VTWARQVLGLPVIAEPAATSSNASGTINEKFASQIVGVDVSGKEVPLAVCLKAESWAGVKTFTPFGLQMQELIVDFRSSSPAELEVKAAALGIDVPGLKAATDAWNAQHPSSPFDFNKALAAEIHNRELLALDLSRTRPADGMIGARS